MVTSSQQLITSEQARNSAFDHALHGTSGTGQGGFKAMMSKDNGARKAAMDQYFQHWDDKKAEDETTEVRQARTDDYATLTRQYYNLATDLYEYAWGGSFHFCRFAHGESFSRAIARHEHFLAHNIGLRPGMKVLDVGCGVGGPAREMAKFAGCHVTGLTICEYQVQRATQYAKKEGLEDKLKFVQGDFMKIPFPDNSFDAIYAIEATVHAPSLQGVYSEILRVLKPGGTFGVYEWLMTDAYDNTNLEHRQIRLDIEQGDGIAQMVTVQEGLDAIKGAGFELKYHEDLADVDIEGTQKKDGSNVAPWYWPIGKDVRYAQTLWDLVTVLRMNRWTRIASHAMMGALESVRVLPYGTKATAESLGRAADALVEGGRRKLFTPMYLMVAVKPLDSKTD